MTGGFELRELVVERIADAALQQAGDVRIELAVLPPQRGNRHDNGRLEVAQARDHLIDSLPEPQLRVRGCLGSLLWRAAHHGRDSAIL